MQKLTLLGRIGKTPELRGDGDSKYCFVSVATSDKWTDKGTGELKEKTIWHDVSFKGKQAETICKYLVKGDGIYIEGKVDIKKPDRDSMTTDNDYRVWYSVIGHRFEFLPVRKDGSSPMPTSDPGGELPPGVTPAGVDDDLPF